MTVSGPSVFLVAMGTPGSSSGIMCAGLTSWSSRLTVDVITGNPAGDAAGGGPAIPASPTWR